MADVEQEPVKKKFFSPMKLLLGSQFLMILGASALIVYSLYFTPKPDTSPERFEERLVASVRDDLSKVQLLDLEDFFVHLPGKHTLKTRLVIELSNPEIAEIIRSRMPVVKSKINQLLGRQPASHTDTLEGKLLLKDLIREGLNEEIFQQGLNSSEGIVRDVYFVEFILI